MILSEDKNTSLQILTRTYYDYQHERIAIDGHLGQKKDGTTKKKAPPRDVAFLSYIQTRRDDLFTVEKELEKEITQKIKAQPLWTNFLVNIKGCGPIMAAVIMTEFDIYKAPMVSNLVSFAGIAPGKDRKTGGEKCPYNQFLKSKLCGVLASGFLRANSIPYSGYYYDYKLRLENSDKLVLEYIKKKDRKKKEYKGKTTRTVKWRDAYACHRHQAANRYMIKLFLQDLYVAWRTLEGLPVREPYSEEKLGHIHHTKMA